MHNNVQGPFFNHKMRNWFQDGYFFDQLKLRNNWSDEWKTLSAWFPQIEQAFQVLVGIARLFELARDDATSARLALFGAWWAANQRGAASFVGGERADGAGATETSGHACRRR